MVSTPIASLFTPIAPVFTPIAYLTSVILPISRIKQLRTYSSTHCVLAQVYNDAPLILIGLSKWSASPNELTAFAATARLCGLADYLCANPRDELNRLMVSLAMPVFVVHSYHSWHISCNSVFILQTPPSSPSSLGSRKSSMCSINSVNSSSSGGSRACHSSPGHHPRHATSQVRQLLCSSNQ